MHKIVKVHYESDLMEGTWLELEGTNNFIVPGKNNFAVFAADVRLLGAADTLHEAMQIAYTLRVGDFILLEEAQYRFESQPSKAQFIWADALGRVCYGDAAWVWVKRNWLARLAQKHFDNVVCGI